MKPMKTRQDILSEEPQRRLSPWRVLLAILLLVGLTYTLFFNFQSWQETRAIASLKPWFAAYVDVTATPTYAFEQLRATPTHNVVLSFIVSSSSDACTPSWGGAYTLSQASTGLDLDRRIERLRKQGGGVVVSFGGALHDELARKCTNADKLLQAYQSVIDRYSIDTIDLDLEGSGLTDNDAAKRRAGVIALIQSRRRAQKKSLAVWLTLPVAPQGLTEDGTNAIAQMLQDNVDIAGINVMTMDYANSRDKNETMEHASERALTETHRQLGILYKRAGISLSEATLWRKIGATPMVGQNDVTDEIFTLQDATGLNDFAQVHGVGRLSMWSANRDVQCGDNYVDLKIVSDSCSGVQQDKLSYSTTLGKGYVGDLPLNAKVITTNDLTTTIQTPDDPQKSPYQIWKETGAYLEGTKVVWHRNVYQAKWWTKGDVPDNPVLQSYQTPWQLIGPILPGEKPFQQPTLPKGTYPEWSGDSEYQSGQRVLFERMPYEAKWWNKAESPAASASNPDSSPWIALTQAQVNEIVAEITASASAK